MENPNITKVQSDEDMDPEVGYNEENKSNKPTPGTLSPSEECESE